MPLQNQSGCPPTSFVRASPPVPVMTAPDQSNPDHLRGARCAAVCSWKPAKMPIFPAEIATPVPFLTLSAGAIGLDGNSVGLFLGDSALVEVDRTISAQISCWLPPESLLNQCRTKAQAPSR